MFPGATRERGAGQASTSDTVGGTSREHAV